MLNWIVVLSAIAVILFINWFLWKSGFLMMAEKPTPLIDKPVIDAKERRAFKKRLKRWRAEGKITREEFEHVNTLADSEWDGPTEDL